jgi:hypothetical protein
VTLPHALLTSMVVLLTSEYRHLMGQPYVHGMHGGPLGSMTILFLPRDSSPNGIKY